MVAKFRALVVASFLAVGSAHDQNKQLPLAGPHKGLWYNTLPGDGGTQVSSWSINWLVSTHGGLIAPRPIRSSVASPRSVVSLTFLA